MFRQRGFGEKRAPSIWPPMPACIGFWSERRRLECDVGGIWRTPANIRASVTFHTAKGTSREGMSRGIFAANWAK
jgi:hypothetical protein